MVELKNKSDICIENAIQTDSKITLKEIGYFIASASDHLVTLQNMSFHKNHQVTPVSEL